MQSLFHKPTQDSPEIILDAQNGVFRIAGTSFSDNPFDVYDPVITWFNDYLKTPNKETVLELKMNYVNTASSKQISDIVALLVRHKDKNIKVRWFYDKQDEDMQYEGETLSMTHEIDFELIPY